MSENWEKDNATSKITEVMNGGRDREVIKFSSEFRFSKDPDKSKRRLERLSGYSRNSREFSLLFSLFKNIGISRLYATNPAVYVETERVELWQRAALAVKELNEEDVLTRVESIKVIGEMLENDGNNTDTPGDNLHQEIVSEFQRYNGIYVD